MKLYETLPELKDPRTRRLIVLEATTLDAALEGLDDVVRDNLVEIEKLRREIDANVFQAEPTKNA